MDETVVASVVACEGNNGDRGASLFEEYEEDDGKLVLLSRLELVFGDVAGRGAMVVGGGVRVGTVSAESNLSIGNPRRHSSISCRKSAMLCDIACCAARIRETAASIASLSFSVRSSNGSGSELEIQSSDILEL